VVFVVILLPIILDKEPGPVGQDLVIQIPSQDAGKFNTRVLPPLPPVAQSPGGDAAKPQDAAKADVPERPPGAHAESKAAAAPETGAEKAPPPQKAPESGEGARAKALLEGGEAWVVPLGAFSSADNVKQLQAKLAAAGMKSYIEVVKGPQGEQTRVRAGPFESKAAADKAREKLAAMGLNPAAATAR